MALVEMEQFRRFGKNHRHIQGLEIISYFAELVLFNKTTSVCFTSCNQKKSVMMRLIAVASIALLLGLSDFVSNSHANLGKKFFGWSVGGGADLEVSDLITNQAHRNMLQRKRYNAAWRKSRDTVLNAFRKQLQQAQQKFQETKGMHSALSSSGGDIIKPAKPHPYLNLPNGLQSIYGETAKNPIAAIGAPNEQEDFFDFGADADAPTKNYRKLAEIRNKALSLDIYKEAESRAQAIRQLADKIGKTKDLQELATLQAYIKGSQVMIQNEITRLQMIAHVSGTERNLLNQHEQKLAVKKLTTGAEMPRIRSQMPITVPVS